VDGSWWIVNSSWLITDGLGDTITKKQAINFYTMAFQFKDLQIWQRALDPTEIVTTVAAKFPKEELYVLTGQIKRAADSTALNIAEGSQGQSKVEFNRFLGIALRSDIEVVACTFVARKRKIISEEDFNLIYQEEESLVKMIHTLRKNYNP